MRYETPDLSVRHRLTLNNAIMVFVPVLLLVIIGSTVFYGLRATGNFREREIELLWPEAGNSAPVLMGLSTSSRMSMAANARARAPCRVDGGGWHRGGCRP